MKYIGQHFIVGLETTELTPNEGRLLEKIQPLGILLFARNFSSKDTWKKECASLIEDAKIASKGSVRFVSIDFEGGRVNRFPEEIKRFPYAQEWCTEAYSVSLEMAHILKDLGFNLTYGPVADVDLNPNNPVIGKRAFSHNSETVSASCLEYKRAYDELGIMTCAKHFPGHGRTFQDSHLELPKISCTIQELEEDLRPFKVLIENNIQLIMTSHVIYQCLDTNYPASQSKLIQTDFLRGSLGYTGLIVSDDMDMKALAHLGTLEKVELALKAGTDILLFGNGMDGKALETVNNIYDELEKSATKELQTAHEESLLRIRKILTKA